MNISSPETPKPPTPLKILLIGPPGSRKTTLALQFPGVLVEDCDRNLDGPERWLRANGHANLSYAYNSVRYKPDGTPRDVADCYNAILDDLKVMYAEYVKYSVIRTIVVDSLSHVNEFIIRHVLKLQNKERKVLEMEARDWSPFKSYAYVLLTGALEQTGKTVICTCHEIKLLEPASKDNMMQQTVIGYEPFFQGKVSDTIGAFFTDVWRLDLRPGPAGRVDCVLQTQRATKCEHLKNSVGMPSEILLKNGYADIEPYLKGKM